MFESLTRPATGALPKGAWLTVGFLWLAGASNYLTRTMLTTMRGSVIADIPMTDAQFGLLTTIFLWVYAFASPLGGFFADRFSRRHVIIFSILAWSTITWITAHVHTFQEFLILRALLGLSEACYIPAAMALIADYHRGSTRSLATGIHMSGLVLGSVIGGVGGWLAESHGWNYAYTVIGLPNLIYSLFLVLVLREAPREAADDHATGAAVPKVGFIAAMENLACTWPFYIVIASWCLQGAVSWMIIGWMPTHMKEQYHLGQGAAGFSALGYVYVMQFLGLLIGGFWSDRCSVRNPQARIVIPAITLLVVAPAFWLTGFYDGIAFTILSLAGWGLAAGFLGANMMPIICMTIDVRYRATALGVLNCFTACFGGVAVYFVGALRDAQVGIRSILTMAGFGVLFCGVLLYLVSVVLTRRAHGSRTTL
ncbi:MFS transporter [Opitutus sp. GAS368]|uniref:MFS transporter n=1 Tax=Opitutus sp. GAS368 TaxID=1882749 RepID=UPI00087B4565|nr:MFS transporter [Opitutus sp. GAS368]SDS47694.1 Major Facilitator Superfamily protein [Opitutus sp. GAS368]